MGPLATADVNFQEPLEKFRRRAAYWLALRSIGTNFQCLGFNMCATSVLLFIAQLYTVPNHMLHEVKEVTLKLMLGPRFWMHGLGGHPYFRGLLDLGMKASPRCPHASTAALTYASTIRFLPDLRGSFGSCRPAHLPNRTLH